MMKLRALCRCLILSAAVAIVPASQSKSQPMPLELVPAIPHTDGVRAMMFSPEGQRLLTVTDSEFKIWEVSSGRLIRTVQAKGLGSLYKASFSNDGALVLAGGGGRPEDDNVAVWRAATGERLHTLIGHESLIELITASPDGKRWITGSKGSARIWNAQTGELMKLVKAPPQCGDLKDVRFEGEKIKGLFMGADAAANNDRFARICDLETGEVQPPFKLQAYVGRIMPDGGHVLLGMNGTLAVYDITTRALTRAFEMDRRIPLSYAVSPDGALIAAGDQNDTIWVWNAVTGKLLRKQFYSGDREKMATEVQSLAFSTDGKILGASGNDSAIKLYDTATGRLIRSLGASGKSTHSVSFSQDGATVVSGSGDGRVRVWDLSVGSLLRSYVHGAGVNAVAFSRDGGRMVSGGDDKTIKYWETDTGRLLRSIQVTPKSEAFHGPTIAEVAAVAVSPDGKSLLSGADIPKLWDASNGKLIRRYEDPELPGWGISSLSFSPDGKQFVLGRENGEVAVMDTANGKSLWITEGDPVSSTIFSKDGKQILSASRNGIDILDAKSGDLVQKLEGSLLAQSNDGRLIVTLTDKNLQVWQGGSRTPRKIFTGDFENVSAAALSPNGARVATAHSDSSVRIWNVENGQLLASFFGGLNDEWLVVTPEGYFAGSDKGADLISIVRGLEVFSVDQLYQTLYRPDLIRQKLSGDPDELVKNAALKLDLERVLSSGAAPRVAITLPAANSTQNSNHVTVQAELRRENGGIGRIEWRVNGVTLGLADTPLEASESIARVERSFPIGEGDNLIEVVAYNAKNLIASAPVSVVVTAKSERPKVTPALFIMVVGVNDYLDPQLRLEYAATDAKAIAEALTLGGRTLYRSVETKMLLDSDVTAEKLEAAFGDFGAKAQPEDVFVFYMAGHGVTEEGQYFFIPHAFKNDSDDAVARTAIGQIKLQQWLARIPALRSVLIYDTCESGSTADDGASFRGGERAVAAARLTRSMGRTVLSATTDNMPALEGHHGHGVFTYVILDSLGRGDRNNNKLIEVSEIARYLDEKVPAISKLYGIRQLPQIKLIGGDFSLINRGAAMDPK